MNQQAQMAMGGPVNAPTPGGGGGLGHDEVLKRLNTAIYDYLLRNSHYDVARIVSQRLDIFKKTDVKQSPNQRNGQQANGVDDSMDLDGTKDSGIKGRPEDLPLPENVVEGPFLQDWWFQFWEIHFAKRNKNPNQQTNQYVAQQRMQQKARLGMMGGMDPASMQNLRGYNGMVPNMNNGMGAMPNDLKRTAMQNRGNMTPHQMAALKNMQGGPQMQGAQMERSGSQMDMSGPRSGSPGSGDAPSPKRARLDGGNAQQMNQGRPGQPGQMQGNQVGPASELPSDPAHAHTHKLLLDRGLDPANFAGVIPELSTTPTNVQVQNVELYSQSLQKQMESAMNKTQSNTQKGMPPNMGPGGAQGSPMSQQGMDGATSEFYAAANGRMPMQANNPQAVAAAAAAGQGNNNGNHALQDYQMQLMLLEQQNKKRLLMARQEQDSMAHPGAQPNGQFPPGASPQGMQRAGNPSPNPSDMQRGMMDPSQVPPNMRAQMMQNGQMARPPSSHPMAQLPPDQQMQIMRQQQQMMPNGQFPPGQQPPGMMPGQQPGGQQPMGTPRQQNSNMPPPPAPANSSGTGPSSPSQQGAAPPTPNQTNKAKPGAKNEPKKKGAANKKGGAAPNAAPATEAEQPPTPTPPTPMTPMNANSFGKGQQQQQQQMPNSQSAAAAQQANAQAHNQNQQQQQNAVQPPAAGAPDMNAPFGSLDNGQFPDMNLDFTLEGGDVLDNFDFDSFLNNDGDGGFGFDANLAFGDGELGIEGAN